MSSHRPLFYFLKTDCEHCESAFRQSLVQKEEQEKTAEEAVKDEADLVLRLK